MKKTIIAFLIIVIVLLVAFGEARNFYCIGDNKCVTVWKTYNNTCYVVPGKYYGLTKPSGNYILTTNISNLDIIWSEDGRKIIVIMDKDSKIVGASSKELTIEDYDLNKLVNDSLYTSFDGAYRRYNKDAKFISLIIEESYAVNRDGKL
jgi:hypothetical protein